MLLFRHEDHINRWCAAHHLGVGAVMTPEQCWQLARAWYQDRLRPGWRRFTMVETEAIFHAVGLHGPFWDVR